MNKESNNPPSSDDVLLASEQSERRDTMTNELTDMPKSRHKQVRVQWDGMVAEIDEEIAPLILELWKARLITMMSCQDNPKGWVWIQFPFVIFAEAFMDLVEKKSDTPSLWQRWRFAIYPVTRPQMAFGDFPKELMPQEPSLRFAVRVRFPKSDLPTVQQTLMKHNEKIVNTLESE